MPIGLGTNTFGRTTDGAESRRVLDGFHEAGGRLIDTADTYSDGESEAILGDWMRRRRNRDHLVIATKCGNHPRLDGLSAATVTAAVEESLRRLGTDHIDLYFAHYQDDRTPIAESVAAFDALVRAGKIRAIGLSNFDADAARAWFEVARRERLTPPSVLQPHYSLVHRRSFEAGLADVAVENGLAVLPYRALGGGFLSAKYRRAADTEGRARGAGVLPLLTSEGVNLIDIINVIADTHDVAAASVSLAWLLRQPTVLAPLVSATTCAQLGEILAAPTVRLTSAEMERLDAASGRMG